MSDAVERLTNWLAMTETVLGNPPIADAVREVLAEVERLREVLKGQPVIKSEWEKLVEENERLRAEAKAQGTQDFTDVLYRATFAEAKIEAALEAVPLSSECAAGHVAAVTKALKGRR
jgi:hypothetical protein